MSRRRSRRRRIAIGGQDLPTGAYRHPMGGIMLPVVRTKYGISVQGQMRDDVDLKRFTRALLDTAQRVLDEDQNKAA
jgi:hypothetical protein